VHPWLFLLLLYRIHLRRIRAFGPFYLFFTNPRNNFSYSAAPIYTNTYFWRTHAQQEIDYIEERDGQLFAYEFKWNEERKARLPASFASAYPEHAFALVNPANYLDFITAG